MGVSSLRLVERLLLDSCDSVSVGVSILLTVRLEAHHRLHGGKPVILYPADRRRCLHCGRFKRDLLPGAADGITGATTFAAPAFVVASLSLCACGWTAGGAGASTAVGWAAPLFDGSTGAGLRGDRRRLIGGGVEAIDRGRLRNHVVGRTDKTLAGRRPA